MSSFCILFGPNLLQISTFSSVHHNWHFSFNSNSTCLTWLGPIFDQSLPYLCTISTTLTTCPLHPSVCVGNELRLVISAQFPWHQHQHIACIAGLCRHCYVELHVQVQQCRSKWAQQCICWLAPPFSLYKNHSSFTSDWKDTALYTRYTCTVEFNHSCNVCALSIHIANLLTSCTAFTHLHLLNINWCFCLSLTFCHRTDDVVHI